MKFILRGLPGRCGHRLTCPLQSKEEFEMTAVSNSPSLSTSQVTKETYSKQNHCKLIIYDFGFKGNHNLAETCKKVSRWPLCFQVEMKEEEVQEVDWVAHFLVIVPLQHPSPQLQIWTWELNKNKKSQVRRFAVGLENFRVGPEIKRWTWPKSNWT